MSSRKVTADNLGEAINDILNEYANTVVTDVRGAVEATGKMAAQTAQTYASAIGRGKYAKSIKSKTTDTNRLGVTVTVYSTQYRIAHLLEHGHVVKRGGKIVGAARAFPHFAMAEAAADSMIMQKIQQAIKGA